jgi:hypothetical protein
MNTQDDDDWFSPDFLPCISEDASPDPTFPLFPSAFDTFAIDFSSPSNPGPRLVVFNRKAESVPATQSFLDFKGNIENDFEAFCRSPDIVFNPRELGFLPLHWPDGMRTFGDLYTGFFKRKNTSSSRFLHKLFNALKIADIEPRYRHFIGVEWVTETVLRVDKTNFARLLGIKTIDGSLFHRQGNFPSHGFVELTIEEARRILRPDLLRGVDFEEVRLLRHEPRMFVRGCGPEVDLSCKWNNYRRSAQNA